eukprot:CAMPEP_0113295160 /NCGR_PEP_ID=MMETSP0008_2-20120614/36302_1 /TAXON_ID=97485 /ORGANISM="Prymnesium parvum" /LENGTH=152 /DNA_ID=CAMNT_0000147857 /DNA_START=86 /DNA_END=541 /DNA_ORIENTATION=+ /assembly_acc=CAM_ASM_000153
MAISKQKVLLPSLSPVVGGGRVASPLRASSPVPPHRLAERQRDGGASLGLWRGPRQLLFDPKQRVEPKPPGLVRLCRAQAVGFRRETRTAQGQRQRTQALDHAEGGMQAYSLCLHSVHRAAHQAARLASARLTGVGTEAQHAAAAAATRALS